MTDSIDDAPAPLDRRQRLLAVSITIATALSRLLSIAHSPWDWDELLFSLGVRKYDVAAHHPHPPGFPLYIAAAKILTMAGLTDFRALQTMSVAAGMLLFPAALFFFLEVRFPFATAAGAATLLAFAPNVWFYGGAALSDVPALTLSLAVCALLLRGARDRRAFLAGALLLGVGAGIRPQLLLIGAFPALVALVAWFRRDRRRAVFLALAAGAIVVAVVAVGYGWAVYKTGWARYSFAVASHQEYIRKIDSFESPERPPLYRVAHDFFFDPWKSLPLNVVLAAAAGLGLLGALIRRRRPDLLVLGAFGPFAVFAWLFLDHFSASRFSIGYDPLLAALAASGIATLARPARRFAIALQAALCAGLVVWMAAFALPALTWVRTHESPPYAAIAWVRANLDRRTSTLFIHDSMLPYSDYYLSDYRRILISNESMPLAAQQAHAWLLREMGPSGEGVTEFIWPHNRVWDLARHRYFKVSIAPLEGSASFGDGWYGPEEGELYVWRWMGGESVTELPARPGTARLAMHLYVPLDALPVHPEITVALNGKVLDRFRADDSNIERTYRVTPLPNAANVLRLSTDRTVKPASTGHGGDERELGLRLDELTWAAADE